MHELFHSNPLIPCRLEILRLGPLQFAPSWDCSICHLGFTPVTIYANGDREQWITLQEWLEKFIGMFWCHFLACCLLSSVTHSKPMGVSAWHWKERLLKYSFKRRRKKRLKMKYPAGKISAPLSRTHSRATPPKRTHTGQQADVFQRLIHIVQQAPVAF